MPVWMTTPVEQQPELTIVRWSVFSIKDDSHLVGYVVENREGRVSSRIISFDPVRQRCVTRSGRVYQLQGEPSLDPDGLYVLARWLLAQGLTQADVEFEDAPFSSEASE